MSSSSSLFHIQQEYLSLAAALEEGELTDELEAQLLITRDELASKCGQYVRVLRELDADIQKAKQVEQQATAYRQRKERAVARLKKSLEDAVTRFGPQRTDVVRLSLRPSTAVEVTDPDELPKQYLIIKQQIKPDKKKIKEDLKAGKSVHGAILVTKDHLSIR